MTTGVKNPATSRSDTVFLFTAHVHFQACGAHDARDAKHRPAFHFEGKADEVGEAALKRLSDSVLYSAHNAPLFHQ